VAADLGATLDRMAYSFGTRTGTILSVTESAPTVVGEAMGGARGIGNTGGSLIPSNLSPEAAAVYDGGVRKFVC